MPTATEFQGCKCQWRPKCEWLGPCGQYAIISEWMPDYSTKRWAPMWLCDDHLAAWQTRPEKLPGIDRPAHADDEWRPSIMDHVRLCLIAEAFEKRQQQADAPVSRKQQPLPAKFVARLEELTRRSL